MKNNTNHIKTITDFLIRYRSEKKELPQSNNFPILSNEKDAYLVQHDAHKNFYSKGLNNGAVIGRKIGCTTKVMQDYLKIPNPCAGRINKSNVYKKNTSLKFDDYVQVGVECELGVFLKHDMPYNKSIYRDRDILNSIKSIFPAIEIVDNRYENWEKTNTNILIADDFFSAGCVIGSPITISKDFNLNKVYGTMKINNNLVGSGYGKDILGNPLNALKWILSRQDIIFEKLPKDSFVLLGSLVQTKWIQKGDTVEIMLDGIGEVKTQFI